MGRGHHPAAGRISFGRACCSIAVPGACATMSRLCSFFALAAMLSACHATAAQPAPPEEYRFTYRPLVVGDQAHETVRYVIDLKTVRSQDGQVIDFNEQTAVRDEQSLVVRLKPEAGQSAKVRLTYEQSQQTTQPRWRRANDRSSSGGQDVHGRPAGRGVADLRRTGPNAAGRRARDRGSHARKSRPAEPAGRVLQRPWHDDRPARCNYRQIIPRSCSRPGIRRSPRSRWS